jgi:hypothetical protein
MDEESTAIDGAYTAAIGNLFNVLLSSFLMAEGDSAQEKIAEEAFKHGLDFNRRVYNKAKTIIEAQVKSGN